MATVQLDRRSESLNESEVFDIFLQELKEEAAKNGETFDLNDDEAREIFELMQDEFLSELEGENCAVAAREEDDDTDRETTDSTEEESFDLTPDVGHNLDDAQDTPIAAPSQLRQVPERLAKIEALQEILPGLPLNRINKVANAFEGILGYPSMLTLTPILRETMPDHVSSRWLKRINSSNAEFALQKASEDGVVDSSLLNSMLQVKSNYGFIQDALDFHAKEFEKHGLVSA